MPMNLWKFKGKVIGKIKEKVNILFTKFGIEVLKLGKLIILIPVAERKFPMTSFKKLKGNYIWTT